MSCRGAAVTLELQEWCCLEMTRMGPWVGEGVQSKDQLLPPYHLASTIQSVFRAIPSGKGVDN